MAKSNPNRTGRPIINRIGQRYGRLIVLSFVDTIATGARRTGARWLCRCDCGNTKVIKASYLTQGTRSCGCLVSEVSSAKNYEHGCTNTPLHRIWNGMVHRCTSPKSDKYYKYGARGIRVCDRWLKFENFRDDMGECPPGMTIDRINNNGNYEPGNCRWADKKTQARNRRSSRLITANGRTQCMYAWAEETRISPNTIWYRIRNGWQPDLAATTPTPDRYHRSESRGCL